MIKPPPKVEKVRMSGKSGGGPVLPRSCEGANMSSLVSGPATEWWDDATLQFRQGKMLEQIAEDIRVRCVRPKTFTLERPYSELSPYTGPQV